jgi:hypothetical protein
LFRAFYPHHARPQPPRRQREFQRQLEARAQQELLRQLPRMLAR